MSTRILSRRHGSYTLSYQKHNFPFQMCLFIFKVLQRETVRKLRLGECPGNDISFFLSAIFDFLLAHKALISIKEHKSKTGLGAAIAIFGWMKSWFARLYSSTGVYMFNTLIQSLS